MSAVLPVAAAPASTPSGARPGFFAHHGIWAPGVRLFRELSFTRKAMVISLAFMLPMLGLLGWLLKTQSEQALAARMDATRQQVALAQRRARAGRDAPLRRRGAEVPWPARAARLVL